MRNLTPEHLRCFAGSCPSVYELDDGRLLIVGELASRPLFGLPSDNQLEIACIIDRALLANIDPFPSNPEAPGPYEDFDPLYVKPRQELELP
jgi:hypothetical protein